MVVFWGCGQTGKRVYEFCSRYGCLPDYFCDSNPNMWRTHYCNTVVIPPKEALEISGCIYFITCDSYNEIKRELELSGVDSERIIRADNMYSYELIRYVEKEIVEYRLSCEADADLIAMDFSGGMVLGGVEIWSFQQAKEIHKLGYNGVYLVTDGIESTASDSTFPAHYVGNSDGLFSATLLDDCLSFFESYKPSHAICNFPYGFFTSACLVKKHLNPKLRIIAAIRSDSEIYYHVYSGWKDYIDICFVISKRIADKLVASGFPKDKIEFLQWKTECKDSLNRSYCSSDGIIRIGYAGRVTVPQKRCDRLFEVAVKLKRKNVRFELNIAGSGDYIGRLKELVSSNGLSDHVIFHGIVDKKDIRLFWENQDIYLNVSDTEGHSNSQVEAMAEGVVPVCSDVSGVRDDITHEISGFVLPVGDIDGLVHYIEYLYNNTEVIEIMGKRAHDTIASYNKKDVSIHWDEVLGE